MTVYLINLLAASAEMDFTLQLVLIGLSFLPETALASIVTRNFLMINFSFA